MKKISLLFFVFLPAFILAQPEVKILPLGKVSKQTVQAATKIIKLYIPQVSVLSREQMPRYTYYQPNHRYRADKLVEWLYEKAGANEVVLAVTDHDISHTKGAVYDYGIMGLANRKGRACVASSKRLRNKANYPKIVIHELGHTAGLGHCPNPKCYMMAGNGGDNTALETGFCIKCTAHLKRKGWKI